MGLGGSGGGAEVVDGVEILDEGGRLTAVIARRRHRECWPFDPGEAEMEILAECGWHFTKKFKSKK